MYEVLSQKGVALMLPLTSKTCTKMSKFFLVCSVFSMMFTMMSWFSDFHGFVSFLNLQEINAAFLYYLCCLFSGISLIFSTSGHSKSLKWLVAFVHFSCVYGIVITVVPLFGGISILIGGYVYLLLPVISQRAKTKWMPIVLLGAPILFSAGCFIWINYRIVLQQDVWEVIPFVIFMTLSGLVGLILSTTLNNGKIKWLLLIINYLFATYFHIVILLQ